MGKKLHLFWLLSCLLFVGCEFNPLSPQSGSFEFNSEGASVLNNPSFPEVTNTGPWGVVSGDLNAITVSAETNIASICRFDTVDRSFASMNFTLFPDNSQLKHSSSYIAQPSQQYRLFIRCKSMTGGGESPVSKQVIFETRNPSDIEPPMLSNLLPSGVLSGATKFVQLMVTTNEQADCKYDVEPRTYSFMRNLLAPSSSNKILHSEIIPVRQDSQYTYYVSCADEKSNIPLVNSKIEFRVDKLGAPDTFPPVISGVQPSGELSSELTNTTLIFSTNEKSNCRYSNLNTGNFNQMLPMNSSDGLTHSQGVNSLSSGQTYQYFFLCRDLANNLSNASTTFTVLEKFPTVNFEILTSNLGENQTTIQLNVKLSKPAKVNSSVNFFISGGTALSGEDFNVFPDTLNFGVGEQEKLIPINIIDDSKEEVSETIIFTLNSPVSVILGTNINHTLTIIDNDKPDPAPVNPTFQDFSNLLTSQQCMSCHDRPGFGNFAVLTDTSKPLESEKLWIDSVSNDGTKKYIVPGNLSQSYLYERWRKVHDNDSITGNMPVGSFSSLMLSKSERKLLENYIMNLKVPELQSQVVTSLPSFEGIGIGDAVGSQVIQGEEVRLNVMSGDLYKSTDNHYFSHVRVYGDFEISALVDVTQNNHMWSKASLVVRDKLSELNFRGNVDLLGFQKSLTVQRYQDSLDTFKKIDNFSNPQFLKMSRLGNKISIYTKSSRYAAWTVVESFDTNIGPLAYVGLSVASWERSNSLSAKFSNVSFKGMVIDNKNLSDSEIIQQVTSGNLSSVKQHDVKEPNFSISDIDGTKKFERFQAVMQTYCIACHSGADPIARNFGNLNSESDWFNLRSYSMATPVIVKGSSKDSYLFKFLKHNQLVGTAASMPKGSPDYKEEYTQYVADWIDSLEIEDGSIAQNCDDVTRLPEPSTVRRVSGIEFNNFIYDLFGLVGNYSDQIPGGSLYKGYDKAGESGILANRTYYNRVSTVATNIINDLFDNKGRLGDKFNCSESSADSCHLNYLFRIAKHAFRDSVSRDHEANIVEIFNRSKELNLGKIEGTKFGLEYILIQPEFHFVFSHDGNQQGIRNLSSQELLVRLSLFLWSSLPDEGDLNQVIAGTMNLQVDQVLSNLIERMLADNRARGFTNDFVGQWLELEKLDGFVSEKYPNIDETLKASMKNESKLLFEHILYNDRPFTELLNANYTFVNGKLSDHYKLGVTSSDMYSRYFYKPEDQRSGVLSHASFLTINSSGVDSKPTSRGRFVIERLMCGELFDLPGNTVEQVRVDPNTPFRETVLDHSKDPSCAGCHQVMDPIGLGLESFDTAGVYRTHYDQAKNFQQVDARGALYMQEFNSLPELTEIIKRQNAFNKCLTEHLIVYSTGIKLNTKHKSADKCSVESVTNQTSDAEMTLKDLVKSVILSNSFRQRDVR